MANVPYGVETLAKISIAWVGCTNVTDRRQTDGPSMTYSEHELEFTFAKNQQFNLHVLYFWHLYTVSLFKFCQYSADVSNLIIFFN